MSYLLTYDLSSDSTQRAMFEGALLDENWNYWMRRPDDKDHHLPNTTRLGAFQTDAEAVSAYRRAISAVRTKYPLFKPKRAVITRYVEVLFECPDTVSISEDPQRARNVLRKTGVSPR